MIWDLFCWHGSGVLVFLESKQTAMRYLNILADQVHPAMLHFYPDGDGYFMDSNATIHLARSVRNSSDEYQTDFQQLPGHSIATELNPIENVWDMVVRRIRQLSLLPSTLVSIN
ncbi:uncharacterized protein TNCV_924331 [Trichonephila clavipes]|nr:uncharacterized protein TNCV_924331 [Trichonephila clavipes]